VADNKTPWYSDGHQLFIVLGLGFVVVVTVGAALYTEAIGDYNSRLPIFLGGGAVSIFLVILLALWWFQILSGSFAEKRDLETTTIDTVPPLSELKSWTQLYVPMVQYGGEREVLLEEQAGSSRKILEWFGWATLLVLFPIANVWLYLLGRVTQERFMSYVPHVVVVLALLTLVRTYFMLGGRSDYETHMLRGLGLAAKGGGSAKVFEGRRRGRRVQVESEGRRTKVDLEVAAPDFEIESENGKFLGVAGLPARNRPALELPKAKRWQGVRVRGSAAGIRVERESRGQNMWLYDLWLAERIAETLD
jgi:hypothetical protein